MKGYYIGVFFLTLCCSAHADENSDILINISNSALCYAFRKSTDTPGVGSAIRKDCEEKRNTETQKENEARQVRLYSEDCQFWIERHAINPNSKTVSGLKKNCGPDYKLN
ncbi:TPA: hypothetical protein VDV55_005771 [Pseudomonas aeruginosa]|nr:hypothetical protein [Pseudomonas aeruginosa]